MLRDFHAAVSAAWTRVVTWSREATIALRNIISMSARRSSKAFLPLMAVLFQQLGAQYIAENPSPPFISPPQRAYVVLGSAMLSCRPAVLLHSAMNHEVKRRVGKHTVIRGVAVIMREGAWFLTAISTLPRRSEKEPLRVTHNLLNDHQNGTSLLGPSILHEILSRATARKVDGIFFYIAGVRPSRRSNGRLTRMGSCTA